MHHSKKSKDDLGLIRILLPLFVFAVSFSAQKLPFKEFSTLNGLAGNYVNRFYQDKKGFVWIATDEGLSRFDGYEFTNYGVNDGLPSQTINDITQDSSGRIWVAANDAGIAFLNDIPNKKPGPHAKFTHIYINPADHAANKVNRILIDSEETLWCLTDNGVYRAKLSESPEFTLFKSYPRSVTGIASNALFRSADGNIWFAIYNELFETRSNQIFSRGHLGDAATSLIIDAVETNDGRILALELSGGLFELDRHTYEWKTVYPRNDRFRWFYSAIKDRNNSVWLGTNGGLIKLDDERTQTFSEAEGLTRHSSISLLEDREGDLWIGNPNAGFSVITDFSVSSYDLPGDAWSIGIAEHDNTVKAFFCKDLRNSIWNCDVSALDIVNEPHGNATDFPRIFPTTDNFTLTKRQDIWGVLYGRSRASKISDTNFQTANGSTIDLKTFVKQPFSANEDISVYRDETNKIWIGRNDSIVSIDPTRNGSADPEKFSWEYPQRPHLFLSDKKGSVWLFLRGTRGGRLTNGEYTSLSSAETVPIDTATVFSDSRGWIWLGTYANGVFVCEDPGRDIPVFRNYNMEHGMLSNSVWSIAEDDHGRMYFGTGKGMNRLDLTKDIWSSLIVGQMVNQIFKDPAGNIWANTTGGPIRFDANVPLLAAGPPPIYITGIMVAGEQIAIPETGSTKIDLNYLSSSQNNITIDFVGLQFSNEDPLRYQYLLEGSDGVWTVPGKNRSISFANLAAGNYNFLVRAINRDGVVSEIPASIHFRILPPIYLRWWFLALAAAIFLTLVYAFYNLRLKRLLEIERMRRVIAGDLHDDIGSDLSKISVLSEVARSRLGSGDASNDDLLNSIAEISREAVSSMRDIVWATDPVRDSIREMIRKMREHAEDILVPQNVEVNFAVSPKNLELKLPMDLRRNLYLVFKESVNNAAKHSACSKVDININVSKHEIDLSIADDGKGFDTSAESGGNGLNNIQNRVKNFGGDVQIFSDSENGTKVEIRLPVR